MVHIKKYTTFKQRNIINGGRSVKKKTVLPFENNPYSIMYHEMAFPMGIIQGNATSDITPWLCGKYINCSFEKDKWKNNKFTISSYDKWAIEDDILTYQHILLYPQLYYGLFEPLITLLRRMIDMGYYIGGSYNEEYIPGKRFYQKKYHPHDFLLIGYNDISKYFVSASFLQDWKFQRHLIPYENMENALKTRMTDKIELFFWKYNKEKTFVLNLDRIISELSDYLASTSSDPICIFDKYWGIEAIQQLTQLYSNCIQDKSLIDIRYTRGIIEHKFYMFMRMDYLYEHCCLKKTSYIYKAQQTYDLAKRVHLLGIKYNFKPNAALISKIENTMNEMLSIEKEYLPDVLFELQNYKGDAT